MKLPQVLHGPRRGQFALLIANGLAQALAALAVAALVSRLVDAAVQPVAAGNPLSRTTTLALLLTLVGVVALLRWHGRVTAERMAQGYVHRVRARLLRKIETISPRAWLSQSRGGMLLRFFGDMTALGNWVSRGLAQLAVSATLCIALTLGLFAYEPALALLPLALLGTAALLAARMTTALDDAVLTLRRARARLASRAAEQIVDSPLLAGGGDLAAPQRRLLRQSRRVRDSAIRTRSRAAALAASIDGLALLAPALGVALLPALVRPGSTSAGDFAALLALGGLLATPLRDLARVFEDWRRGRIARAKLQAFLELPDLRSGPESLGNEEYPVSLEIRAVPLGDPARALSLTIPAGEKQLLLMPRGAARAELVSLLLRTTEPRDGFVRLNGISLRRIARRELRRAVAIAGSGVLPAGTRGLSDTAQRQRALQQAIARAPRLLIVEGIDGGGEAALRNAAIAQLRALPTTVLFITDDPAWRTEFDRVEIVDMPSTANVTPLRRATP